MYLNTHKKQEAFTKANDAIMRESIHAMRKSNDAIMRKSIKRNLINCNSTTNGVGLRNNRIVKIAINRKAPSHYISLYRAKRSINGHKQNGIFTQKIIDRRQKLWLRLLRHQMTCDNSRNDTVYRPRGHCCCLMHSSGALPLPRVYQDGRLRTLKKEGAPLLMIHPLISG